MSSITALDKVVENNDIDVVVKKCLECVKKIQGLVDVEKSRMGFEDPVRHLQGLHSLRVEIADLLLVLHQFEDHERVLRDTAYTRRKVTEKETEMRYRGEPSFNAGEAKLMSVVESKENRETADDHDHKFRQLKHLSEDMEHHLHIVAGVIRTLEEEYVQANYNNSN